MGKPKKRTTPRRTGTRRSHLVRKLAATVNGLSPVKVIISKKARAKKAAKTTSK